MISSVTVVTGEYESSSSMGTPAFELHAADGTLLGSGSGTTSTSPGNIDQATFTGISYSQLAGLRVRTYASQGSALSGATATVNWVSLVVAFTPAGNVAITPATLNAPAGFPQCAVSTGEAVTPATVTATAGFPQCTAGLLAATVQAVTLNATAGFPSGSTSGIVNAAITPGDTLAAAAGFPQCTAGLLAASAQASAITALAGFPQCSASGTVNAAPAPAVLAAAAGFPQCSAGLLAATAQASVITALAGFPQCAASGVANAAVTAVTLAATAQIPACLVIASATGPEYAGAADVLAGGTGTWSDPSAATGPPPEPVGAGWAVP